MRANDGSTVLHSACNATWEGLEAAVELLLRWGVDETALDDQNSTRSALLDTKNLCDHVHCSKEEVERTRLLLARAPADRAWRRRCWLVILRSRVSKANMTACDSGLTAEAEGCKVARIRQAGGVTCGMSVQASRCGIAVAARNNGERDLNGIVALLIGLEVEGVFRAVCSFLWRDMRTHSRKTAWMIVGPEVRLFGAYMSRDRLLLLRCCCCCCCRWWWWWWWWCFSHELFFRVTRC